MHIRIAYCLIKGAHASSLRLTAATYICWSIYSRHALTQSHSPALTLNPPHSLISAHTCTYKLTDTLIHSYTHKLARSRAHSPRGDPNRSFVNFISLSGRPRGVSENAAHFTGRGRLRCTATVKGRSRDWRASLIVLSIRFPDGPNTATTMSFRLICSTCTPREEWFKSLTPHTNPHTDLPTRSHLCKCETGDECFQVNNNTSPKAGV